MFHFPIVNFFPLFNSDKIFPKLNELLDIKFNHRYDLARYLFGKKRRYTSRINNNDSCSLFHLLFFMLHPQAAEENNQMYNDDRKIFPSSRLYVLYC